MNNCCFNCSIQNNSFLLSLILSHNDLWSHLKLFTFSQPTHNQCKEFSDICCLVILIVNTVKDGDSVFSETSYQLHILFTNKCNEKIKHKCSYSKNIHCT